MSHMSEIDSSRVISEIAVQQERLAGSVPVELASGFQAAVGEQAAAAAGIDWADVVHAPAGDSAAAGSDTTYTLFRAAGKARQKPVVVAEAMAAALPPDQVEGAQVVVGHVNVAWTRATIADRASDMAQNGLRAQPAPVGKVAVIDYASPNIAKPLGVNHLRSTVQGVVLRNILGVSGYTVIGDNHLGDWGTQFGHLLAA